MSTALYRRYRPETFAEVIGQEHVTEPLMAALRADRVSHAYLFSGPRGCGKTTSARILARCLNCATGPTDTPCGTCPSCVDLARGGPGSLDVVEMDAASHGGVDDARDLRERAAFAPARDRYKIFIIDEAHMVTPQGFNALLKLVEEPPEHVKFIFATTEPEKVIGTIRSRTHHYPFRLVPPERLQAYLHELCETEGVQVEAGVLPLVVRAGGGSVRDSLSVLDQLIGGAVDGALDYHRAVTLLGYTDSALLDDAMDALAARDGASFFRVIDRVVETGHDPRRFVEDLLQRLRDVVLVAIAGPQAAATLHGTPEDQVARIRNQAQHLGAAQASRAADLVNDALSEMGGATSPRLHLELLAARLLLPATDASGIGARLEKLEQQVATGVVPAATSPAPTVEAPAPPAAEIAVPPAMPAGAPVPAAAATTTAPDPAPAQAHPGADATGDRPPRQSAEERSARTVEVAQPHADATGDRPEQPDAVDPSRQPHAAAPVARPPAAQPAPAPGPQPSAPPSPAPRPAGPDAEMIRRRWPEVVGTLARLRRSTWALVSQNAQVASVGGDVLRLSFTTAGLAKTFRSGPHAAPVQQALAETLGVQLRVEAVVDEGGGDGPGGGSPAGWGGPGGGRPVTPQPPVPSPVEAARASWNTPPDAPSAPTPNGMVVELSASGVRAGVAAGRSTGAVAGSAAVAATGASTGTATAVETRTRPSAPSADDWEPGPEPDFQDGPPLEGVAAPDAARPAEPEVGTAWNAATVPGPGAAAPVTAPSAEPLPQRIAPEDDEPSMDDPDAEGSGLVGIPLVAQVLGGTIIEDGPVGPQG